jgi:hypothetical protein
VRAAIAPPGLRLSTEARGMIPWCIVLSISAHVLLLAGAGPSGPRLGGLASRSRATPERVSMTLVPVAASPQPAGIAMPAPVPDALPAVLQPAASLAAAVAASAASASDSSPQGRLDPSAASTSAAASASLVASVPSVAASEVLAQAPAARPAAPAAPDPWTPGNPARGAYLPRPLLSIAPKIKAEVVIAMPPGADDGARHVGVLSLFIDEQGRVRHIEPDDPALPPDMEQAAQEAFMSARFSPGQVGGRVVKARINVEVVFESALEAASPRAAAGASAAGSAASAQRSP